MDLIFETRTREDPSLDPNRLSDYGEVSSLVESHDKSCWKLMKKEASPQLAGVVLYLHTIFVVPGARSPHVLDIAHPWIASRRRRRPKGFWREV